MDSNNAAVSTGADAGGTASEVSSQRESSGTQVIGTAFAEEFSDSGQEIAPVMIDPSMPDSEKGNGIPDPRGYATRAEAAAMLMRYLTLLK